GVLQYFDNRVLDTGDSLGELRRESFDGLDGYDRGVGVELKRCGWSRKVKAADAVCIPGIDGIVIGLDDADEGRFGDARRHVVTSTYIRLFQEQFRELTGTHAHRKSQLQIRQLHTGPASATITTGVLVVSRTASRLQCTSEVRSGSVASHPDVRDAAGFAAYVHVLDQHTHLVAAQVAIIILGANRSRSPRQ